MVPCEAVVEREHRRCGQLRSESNGYLPRLSTDSSLTIWDSTAKPCTPLKSISFQGPSPNISPHTVNSSTSFVSGPCSLPSPGRVVDPFYRYTIYSTSLRLLIQSSIRLLFRLFFKYSSIKQLDKTLIDNLFDYYGHLSLPNVNDPLGRSVEREELDVIS
jgi:hypothetical protein